MKVAGNLLHVSIATKYHTHQGLNIIDTRLFQCVNICVPGEPGNEATASIILTENWRLGRSENEAEQPSSWWGLVHPNMFMPAH